MSGLDKIKSQILDEANHSAEVKLAEANEKAERMLSEAKAEAEAEVSRLQAKSQEAVAVYADRVKSSGEMQRKQAILQAKQEVIADVLQNAYEKVCAQDDHKDARKICPAWGRHHLFQCEGSEAYAEGI